MGMLVHFLTGQLSTTQQIVDIQAVAASCVLGRTAKSRFLETEGKTGLEAFPSSFPPPHRDWSCVLGLKHCTLSWISTCSIFQSLLYCALTSSCAISVQFASRSLGYKGAELHELLQVGTLHAATPLSCPVNSPVLQSSSPATPVLLHHTS